MENELKAILVTDPLGELSRKERKTLLIVSLVAFAMTMAGLVPREFIFLGIRSEMVNVKAVFGLLGIVLLYCWISFMLHAIPEFMSWLSKYYELRHKEFVQRMSNEEEYGDDDGYAPTEYEAKYADVMAESSRRAAIPFLIARRMIFLRAGLWDIMIPATVGLAGLWFTACAIVSGMK